MSRLSDMLREANTENLGVRDIARRAQDMGLNLSAGTVSRYMKGQHPETPNATTVAAFARVLNVSVVELQMAATFSGREPFVPDPVSDRLTPPQRAVLNDLIRVMVDANEKAGDGDAEATPPTQAGVSPAPEDDGLGSFGGRARGDLDHESVNDGAGDNVHRLHPDLENMAAYRTGKETEKQRLLREEAERENESQDPDDWE